MQRMMKLNQDNGLAFVGLWLGAVLISLLLAARFQGAIVDQSHFVSWLHTVGQFGLGGAYRTSQIAVPPLYPALLALMGKVCSALHLHVMPGRVIMKLPGLAVDAFAMIVFYRESKSISGASKSVLWILFCLNPAILFDIGVYGQIDIIGGILCVLAVLLALRRPSASGLIWALALLMTGQAVLILPLLVVTAVKQQRSGSGHRAGFNLVLGMAIPLIACTAFFLMRGDLVPMIRHAYLTPMTRPSQVSGYAMNIWFHLFGTDPSLSDRFTLFGILCLKLVGLILVTAAVCFACAYLSVAEQVTKERLLKAAALVMLAGCMLLTGIYAHTIVTAVVAALFAARRDSRWQLMASGLTITAFWNLWTVLYATPTAVADMWMVYWNTVILIAMVVLTAKDMGRTSVVPLLEQPDESHLADTKVSW